MYRKDIERILNTVKVEDNHIMLGEPTEVEFYGRKFVIRQLNWFYKWKKFVYWMGLFLNCYANIVGRMSLPDGLADLMDFRKNIRLTMGNTIYGRVAFNAICKMAGFYGVNHSWAKKTFTLDDWAELFVIIYVYNIFGVKKNLKNAFNLLSKVR